MLQLYEGICLWAQYQDDEKEEKKASIKVLNP